MRKFLIKKMSIFLTEECNWACEYCDIPKLKVHNPPNFDLIKKYLPLIDKSDSFIHYTITGGEPGLVLEEIWDFIFDTLVCHPIRINTNGTFFKNGFYDKYYDKIWEIGLHVDLNKNIDIQIEDKKIWYYLPCTKQNYEEVLDFVRSYPKLQFSLIPYLHKCFDNDYESNRLEIKDYIKLNESISKCSNVGACGKEYLNLVGRAYVNKKLFRDVCKASYIQPIIDFVNGRIGRCIFSYTNTSYVQLTSKNLSDLFNFKLDFGENDKGCDICDECFRYFDYYFNNQMCVHK